MNDRYVLSTELDGGLYTLKIAKLLTLIPIISRLLLHSGSLITEKKIAFLMQKQIPPLFFLLLRSYLIALVTCSGKNCFFV